MDYKIIFTLANSGESFIVTDSCEVYSESQMEERVAYIIGTKLQRLGIKGKAQKVTLYSNDDKIIGSSDDICEIGSLKLYI